MIHPEPSKDIYHVQSLALCYILLCLLPLGLEDPHGRDCLYVYMHMHVLSILLALIVTIIGPHFLSITKANKKQVPLRYPNMGFQNLSKALNSLALNSKIQWLQWLLCFKAGHLGIKKKVQIFWGKCFTTGWLQNLIWQLHFAPLCLRLMEVGTAPTSSLLSAKGLNNLSR